MPVKKRIKKTPPRARAKLKSEQQDHEAAIVEIERFLNVEVQKPESKPKRKKMPAIRKQTQPIVQNQSAETPPLAKRVKSIAVKNQSQRSPYLVDLKKIAEEQEARDLAQETRERRFFQNIHFSLPRARNIKIPDVPARAQKLSFAAESLSRRLCHSGTGFYHRHERMLGQLFVINVIMLAGFALWRLGRIFYSAGATVGRYVWYTIHDVALFVGTNTFTARFIGFVSGVGEHIAAFAHTLKKTGVYTIQKENELVNFVKKNAVKSVSKIKDGGNSALAALRTWRFLPPNSWRRQVAVFAALAVLLIVPLKAAHYLSIFHNLKGEVLGASEQALGSLENAATAGEALNFAGAADDFSAAAQSFSTAGVALKDYSDLISLATILPGKKAKAAAAAEALLRSGQSAAEAGKHLALALASLQMPYLTPGQSDADAASELPFTQRLRAFGVETELAAKALDDFAARIKSVDIESVAALPDAHAADIARQAAALQTNAGLMVSGAREAADLAHALAIFLGDEQDTRYLLIFQNNAEMRASGGFIGSYALVDFRKGAIKNIEVPAGGSYDLQGGLAERFSAPKPLHLINSLWEFQDANWWPDWPRSAAQIERFFESGWGSSVDGVIAIDPTFVEELLAVIGPIDMTAQYGTVVTNENFYDVAQNREDVADPKKPKAVIKDLVEKIVAELPNRITRDNFAACVNVMAQALVEKHLLVNVHDEAIQDFITAHGWDGGIRDTAQDYAAVINTNIAGGKTDRKIRQSIAHTAEVTPDGSIIDTVEITREHTAAKGDPYAGVRNVNYLRLYVPKGSVLIAASGFAVPDLIYFDPPADGVTAEPDIALIEKNTVIDQDSGVQIYNEFNKTVFANWTQVDPGQTITVRFKYKLPFKVHGVKQSSGFWQRLWQGDYELSSYSLLAQKQAGSVSSNFSSSLHLPGNMTVQGSGVLQAGIGPGGWEITDGLKADSYWGVVIKKE